MQAIIVATQTAPVWAAGIPPYLLPLGGRPFLQYLLEELAEQGICEWDVLLSSAPETLTSLRNWQRPPGRLRWHVVANPARPYAALRQLSLRSEAVLLAHADCLPLTNLTDYRTVPAFYYWRNASEDELEWTGWAWLSATELAALPTQVKPAQLELQLLSLSRERSHLHKLRDVLSVRSQAAWQAAQQTCSLQLNAYVASA